MAALPSYSNFHLRCNRSIEIAIQGILRIVSVSNWRTEHRTRSRVTYPRTATTTFTPTQISVARSQFEKPHACRHSQTTIYSVDQGPSNTNRSGTLYRRFWHVKSLKHLWTCLRDQSPKCDHDSKAQPPCERPRQLRRRGGHQTGMKDRQFRFAI